MASIDGPSPSHIGADALRPEDELLRCDVSIGVLRQQIRQLSLQLVETEQKQLRLAAARRSSPSSAAIDGESARLIARSAHEAGHAAVFSDVVHQTIASDAFNAFADFIATLRKEPGMQAVIDRQLLGGGPEDAALAVPARSAADDQRLHYFDAGYQANNGLIDHLPVIAAMEARTLIEIGCGNGRFLREISSEIEHVTGIDWVRSPLLGTLPGNADFLQADIVAGDLPKADLCCSAHVLEYINPADIPGLLHKLHAAAPGGFHVIACHDDGEGRRSIFHPGQWLSLFRTVDADYQLLSITATEGRADRLQCILSNCAPAVDGRARFGGVAGEWQTNTGQEVTFQDDLSVVVDARTIGTWLPMPNRRSASMFWRESGMMDLVSLSKDGQTLSIRNFLGEVHHVNRK